ncbi:DUF5074 domain-containing protein [Namhaeicola litoreus]|uniref:DUF5074 domain-containing protein n=1 Tax=Namhaeicola litoreus TaxID=1052145 RepID=A0ABW3Y2C6_9FLAO
MMYLKNLVILFVFSLIIFGCSDDDKEIEEKGEFANGFFITNEGPFNNGSGSITHVSEEGLITQKVYQKVNNEVLGNIVQSMSFHEDKAYIVVNNSNKIVVVDRYTMEKIGTIQGEGVNSPRHMVSHNNRGYLSNWGDPVNNSDDFISVIDLNNDNVIETIPVGEGPENMVISNGKLFVNLEGGYSQNKYVMVVNLNSLENLGMLEVSDVPNSILRDDKDQVWVLCGGKPSWTGDETHGSLFKINPTDLSLDQIDFTDSQHPDLLTFTNGSLYFNLDGQVLKMNTATMSDPIDIVQGIEGYFYSMNSLNGELYATDAKDFQSEGELKIFNAITSTVLETIETGVIPGSVVFQ